MIIDITNELFTDIKNELVGMNGLSSYQSTVSKFPTIIIEEIDNSHYRNSKDSSGFQHSNIAYSIEIYTTGNGRMTEAKKIRNRIDNVISGKYGLARGKPTVVPNYLDNSIYRYKLTYSGLIDKTKTIYRG